MLPRRTRATKRSDEGTKRQRGKGAPPRAHLPGPQLAPVDEAVGDAGLPELSAREHAHQADRERAQDEPGTLPGAFEKFRTRGGVR